MILGSEVSWKGRSGATCLMIILSKQRYHLNWKYLWCKYSGTTILVMGCYTGLIMCCYKCTSEFSCANKPSRGKCSTFYCSLMKAWNVKRTACVICPWKGKMVVLSILLALWQTKRTWRQACCTTAQCSLPLIIINA